MSAGGRLSPAEAPREPALSFETGEPSLRVVLAGLADVREFCVQTWRAARDQLAPDRAIEGKAPMAPVHVEGRFEILPRTDGRFVVIDPDRPWNAASVAVRPSLEEAQAWAKERS